MDFLLISPIFPEISRFPRPAFLHLHRFRPAKNAAAQPKSDSSVFIIIVSYYAVFTTSVPPEGRVTVFSSAPTAVMVTPEMASN